MDVTKIHVSFCHVPTLQIWLSWLSCSRTTEREWPSLCLLAKKMKSWKSRMILILKSFKRNARNLGMMSKMTTHQNGRGLLKRWWFLILTYYSARQSFSHAMKGVNTGVRHLFSMPRLTKVYKTKESLELLTSTQTTQIFLKLAFFDTAVLCQMDQESSLILMAYAGFSICVTVTRFTHVKIRRLIKKSAG